MIRFVMSKGSVRQLRGDILHFIAFVANATDFKFLNVEMQPAASKITSKVFCCNLYMLSI